MFREGNWMCWIDKALFLGSILWFASGCDEKETIPTLTTVPVSAITSEGAQSGGEITDDGGFAVLEKGVCWSTSPNPTKHLPTHTLEGEGAESYTSTITGLSPGVLYYVRAYATNALGTAYGEELSFSSNPIPPTISSTLPILISSMTTQGTATSGGEVNSDGGGPITARGVCWSSTDAKPTVSLSTKTIDGDGVGKFTSTMTGLSYSTYYYVRAYATNSAGTVYGDVQGFRMGGPPAVSDLLLTEVTKFDGLFKFGISHFDKIDEYGVCWNTSPNPVIEQNARTLGWNKPLVTASPFSSSQYFVNERCSALTPGATYFVRGYAKNKWGVTYTPQASFETRTVEGQLIFHYGYYAGGIFAYKNETENYSLIVASGRFDGDDTYYGFDLKLLSYGCKGQTLGATTNGVENTALIVANCADKSNAATYTDSFVLNSFSDWYLPSIEELVLMRASLKANGFLGESDTIAWRYLDDTFLSSTEADANSVWVLSFVTGEKYTVPKDTKVAVLPVRAIK